MAEGEARDAKRQYLKLLRYNYFLVVSSDFLVLPF